MRLCTFYKDEYDFYYVDQFGRVWRIQPGKSEAELLNILPDEAGEYTEFDVPLSDNVFALPHYAKREVIENAIGVAMFYVKQFCGGIPPSTVFLNRWLSDTFDCTTFSFDAQEHRVTEEETRKLFVDTVKSGVIEFLDDWERRLKELGGKEASELLDALERDYGELVKE